MTSSLRRSRRGFLKSLFLTAAAAATGGLFAPAAKAGLVGKRDVVTAFDVGGLKAADHVVGGILIQSEDYDYLTFDAWKRDENGRVVGSGTAVIRLTDCVAWRSRVDGDQHLLDAPVDPSKLTAGGVFEVVNSSWVQDLADDDASLVRENLHHCVFTFQETSFECVLARYDHMIHTGSFDALYEDLMADGW